MVILETPRLVFRHFAAADLPALAALYSDRDVRRYFPEGTLSLAETEVELDWHLARARAGDRLGLWAVVDRRSGVLVGRCGLIAWTIEGRPEVEVAYLIGKDHWRQGLGTEAACALVRHGFDANGFDRLIALIDKDNAASRRTAAKAGFRFERSVEVEGSPAELHSIEKPSRGQNGARARKYQTKA
jgi:RimJ/RimL family protein N-acetyltransferase